jgi:hypothetical protein
MTEENKPRDGLDDTSINALLAENKKSRALKTSIILRVTGFALLLCALVLMFSWRQGSIQPVFKNLSYVIAFAGLVVYLAGRILAFMQPKKK